MRKVLFGVANFVAVTLFCTDFLYKLQNVGYPGYFSTTFIVLFLGIIIKFMVEIDIAYVKRGKGIIFRPPFLKPKYFEDYNAFVYKRIGVYAIFGLLVGVMFYLSRSAIVWDIPQIIEILAISTMFFVLAWGMFENFVKRYERITKGDLSKEIEYKF